MDSLYGSEAAFQTKFAQSVDQMVKAGWYTESDGKQMMQEAARR